jgi:hypothetical protein
MWPWNAPLNASTANRFSESLQNRECTIGFDFRQTA